MSFAGFPSPPGSGSSPAPITHDLLSASHSDTTPEAPLAGDIIISATGIFWKRLPVGSELDHLVIVAGVPSWTAQAGSGLGDVTGPSASTDNALVRFDGISGKVIQEGLILIDDLGNISIEGNTFVSGDLTVLGNIAGLDLAASGFVVGPALATDDALALYDGITGELIKNSAITATAGGSGLVIPGTLTVAGTTNITLSSLDLTGAVGDILYASGTDEFGNISIGAVGEVLTVVSGIPAWAAAAGGVTDPLTVGFLTVVSGATLPAFDSLVVKSSGVSELGLVTAGSWQGSGITQEYGGTEQTSYNPGDILYADGAGNLQVLPSGDEGQVLTIFNGGITWV